MPWLLPDWDGCRKGKDDYYDFIYVFWTWENVGNYLRDNEAFKTAHFICGTGAQGGYTWAVLIGGVGDSSRVVAIVAPTEHFSAADLSAFDGSVCDYVAYVDLFSSLERSDEGE